MKRLTALCAAVALTLLLAAPAAANKTVFEFKNLPFGFEEQVTMDIGRNSDGKDRPVERLYRVREATTRGR